MCKAALTPEERQRIWRVIMTTMQPDDQDPAEVIASCYDGDEDEYLRVMAKYHRIPLS